MKKYVSSPHRAQKLASDPGKWTVAGALKYKQALDAKGVLSIVAGVWQVPQKYLSVYQLGG